MNYARRVFWLPCGHVALCQFHSISARQKVMGRHTLCLRNSICATALGLLVVRHCAKRPTQGRALSLLPLQHAQQLDTIWVIENAVKLW